MIGIVACSIGPCPWQVESEAALEVEATIKHEAYLVAFGQKLKAIAKQALGCPRRSAVSGSCVLKKAAGFGSKSLLIE